MAGVQFLLLRVGVADRESGEEVREPAPGSPISLIRGFFTALREDIRPAGVDAVDPPASSPSRLGAFLVLKLLADIALV